MTETPETAADPIATLLEGLGKSIRDERNESPAYQLMAASRGVNGVVRNLQHQAIAPILNASDVLAEKFGIGKSHPVYDYLFEIPLRMKVYEAAFNNETHVGCVDRAADKVTAELLAINQGTPRTATTSRRAARAALMAGVSDADAAAVLEAARILDEAKGVQRVSTDIHSTFEKLSAAHPELDQGTLISILREAFTHAVRAVADKEGAKVEDE